jgi:hypothetical protein
VSIGKTGTGVHYHPLHMPLFFIKLKGPYLAQIAIVGMDSIFLEFFHPLQLHLILRGSLTCLRVWRRLSFHAAIIEGASPVYMHRVHVVQGSSED